MFSFEIRSFRGVLHASIKVAALVTLTLSCTPTDTVGSCTRPDLAFGGDVLLHSLIQSDAASRPEGFAPAFAALAPALGRAEVSVVNLEGPAARNIAPGGGLRSDPGTLFDGHIYSGYPRFNYHPSIAAVLRNAGVDVVQTANNHAMDRGAVGVDLTLSALAEAGLATVGTRPQGSPSDWHTTRNVAGRQLAFVACTFSTNGLSDRGNQALGC